jgi:hypothetical protein
MWFSFPGAMDNVQSTSHVYKRKHAALLSMSKNLLLAYEHKPVTNIDEKGVFISQIRKRAFPQNVPIMLSLAYNINDTQERGNTFIYSCPTFPRKYCYVNR